MTKKKAMENNNFKVIITKSDDTSGEIAQKIADLFKISPDKAADILQQNEFVIKKQTDKPTAEKFHKAISNAGANCRIEEIQTEEETELPTIQDIATPVETKPLTDPTRTDIEPLQSKPLNFSLEERLAEKNTKDDTEQPQFKSIDAAHFCPECGTIRSGEDSACVHCGYDPGAIKNRNTKAALIKAGFGIGVLIVAAIFALPFYQQYEKQAQIQNDLKLAFDTRNKVTEFIQRTNFWPNQNIDADLPKLISNQSIESVVIGNGAVITITLKKQVIEALDLNANNRTLIFTPATLKGRIVWNCLKGTLNKSLRPEICRKQDNS